MCKLMKRPPQTHCQGRRDKELEAVSREDKALLLDRVGDPLETPPCTAAGTDTG